jgi:ferritin-like metal-binding protein YciE
MVGKTTSSELRSAFENHLAETRNQVLRIERVFEMHGAEPKAGSCPAIDGLINEADEVTGDIGDKQVLDAALIAAAQSVEHYEIGRYGTLISWVRQLGRDDCARVLIPFPHQSDLMM